jgi:hypothetical protein
MMCESLSEIAAQSPDEMAVCHQDFADFVADEENHGAYDLVFASESAHLLGDGERVLRDLARLLAQGSVLAVRLATREQIPGRSWAKWYPEAREIDEGRHPGIVELDAALKAARLSGYVREIDESRSMSVARFRMLLANRCFSSLYLMSESGHQRGTEEMLRATQGLRHIWWEHPMTWLVVGQGVPTNGARFPSGRGDGRRRAG